MARNSHYKIEAIDVVRRHVQKARSDIQAAGMDSAINVRHGYPHRLEAFADNSLDGVYTMETLVHSTDPVKVLKEFLRMLKPGGRIALNEYDHIDLNNAPKSLADSMKKVTKYAAIPANASFDKDVPKELLEFQDVQLKDLSSHIPPMLWLFYVMAIIPYLITRFLGVEQKFVNVLAGVQSYRGRTAWKYV